MMVAKVLAEDKRLRLAMASQEGVISHAGGPICLVNRNVLDFSLMFHDVKSPTRPTLISQGVGVSLTLTQRGWRIQPQNRRLASAQSRQQSGTSSF